MFEKAPAARAAAAAALQLADARSDPRTTRAPPRLRRGPRREAEYDRPPAFDPNAAGKLRRACPVTPADRSCESSCRDLRVVAGDSRSACRSVLPDLFFDLCSAGTLARARAFSRS